MLYDESIDYDTAQLDGGASAHGGQAIDPAKLPRAKTAQGCEPVYPSWFLRTNTSFGVAHDAGMLNGRLLFGAERLRRRAPGPEALFGDADARVATRLSWRDAIGVGTAQAITLIPGFSRSGATMGGGLLVGLSNEDAARFAFLLATPIIGAAAALKLPQLFGSQGDGVRGPAAAGALGAAFTAYLAVRFLVRYFETNRLTPFAIYCTAAGALLSVYFLLS